MASPVTIIHLSDLHFGGYADLKQIEALEEFLPSLDATALVVSGDLSQRARHGEFQAAHVFLHRLRMKIPALIVPGNHDVEWWKSPFGLLGEKRKFSKYLRYYGELRPQLEVPGALIAGAVSSYGLAVGSLTWNLRDIAVKGHLPRSETKRIKKLFAAGPPELAKVLVVHHNVLAGGTGRMGLARWRSAHKRLLDTGADAILCGHDHFEGAGQIEGGITVSTSGTHSYRQRGGRPSVFNLVTLDGQSVNIQHFRWISGDRQFIPSDKFSFARKGASKVAVSIAGGDQGL